MGRGHAAGFGNMGSFVHVVQSCDIIGARSRPFNWGAPAVSWSITRSSKVIATSNSALLNAIDPCE